MEMINIILLGESGVGKSTVLYRYMKRVFREHLEVTFVDKCYKNVNIDGQDIKICIWDTAGQEQFRSLISRYFRVADGVLLVCNVNDFDSCKALQDWLSQLRSLNDSAVVIIVGNMNEDPATKSERGLKVVQQLVDDENLEYAEMSAKTGENVDEVFQYLTEKVLVAKGILDYCDPPAFVVSSNLNRTGDSERTIDNGVAITEPRNRKMIAIKENDHSSYIHLEDGVINLSEEPKGKEGGCCC